jgi:hypothetical protein
VSTSPLDATSWASRRSRSLSRVTAATVPAAVRDPRSYCDDPSPAETDTLAETDIGFLESCS